MADGILQQHIECLDLIRFLFKMVCILSFGYDENADGGKGGERLFNLSRMKNLENTKRTFELPANFEFSSSQSSKVLEWVLSLGANARPRALEEFVERWKKEIHTLDRLI